MHDRAQTPQRASTFTVLLALGAILGGCTLMPPSADDLPEPQPARKRTTVIAPPPKADPQAHSPIVERTPVAVPAHEPGPPPPDYIIGPNDVLYVNVYGQPELGSPVFQANGRALGSRVDGAGRVQLPMVGAVHVAGMTPAAAQAKLQEQYAKLITKPWVVVELLERRSQPVYLIGRFNRPHVHYMERPTSLVQAIAIADGLSDTADLRGAKLMRQDRVLPVDIYSLLREGRIDLDVWLQPLDTVYIPDTEDQIVFVLGKVDTPGPVEMVKGRLTLTQALASAGGFEHPETQVNQVRIIRSISAIRGELLVVDLARILEGVSLPFALMPGDVVYVPRNEKGDWNDAIREIQPTLELFAGLLRPFVQISVLGD